MPLKVILGYNTCVRDTQKDYLHASTNQNNTEMKIPRVMRNINEFNVPSDRSEGFEIMYFGVNQILMLEYRLSFDVSVKNSDKEIQVLIISRKDVSAWKNKDDTLELKIFYDNHGIKINDTLDLLIVIPTHLL